jgi:vacuolar-type H+-ATPase subunit F/Vma7
MSQVEEHLKKLEEEVDKLKKGCGVMIIESNLKKYLRDLFDELKREAIIPFEQKVLGRVDSLEERVKKLESKALQNKTE